MKSTTLRRTGATAAAIAALSLSLVACGDDSNDTAADSGSTPSASASESTDSGSSDAGAQVFGPACSAVPTSGKGSFDGMVNDPVATAASNNPLLKTLVKAVGVAGLGDTLNGLEAATVFAPTDDAFAALPAATLNSVLKDKALLTKILTHHVLPENLNPEDVIGTQKTVNGDELTVAGDTEAGITVKDAKVTAKVLCGNIPTKNATVYVIDSVLVGAK